MDEGKIKEIRTPEKPISTRETTNLWWTFIWGVAKKSSDDTSALKNNTKTKLERRISWGCSIWIPQLGYKRNYHGKRFDRKNKQCLRIQENTQRIEQDPIEAPIIRKLIDLALTGASAWQCFKRRRINSDSKGRFQRKELQHNLLLMSFSNIFGEIQLCGKSMGWYSGTIDDKKTNTAKFKKILSENSRPHRKKNEYRFFNVGRVPWLWRFIERRLKKGTKYYRCSKAKGKNATCSPYRAYSRRWFGKKLQETLLKVRLPKKLIDWALKYLGKVYEAETTVFQQNKHSCIKIWV